MADITIDSANVPRKLVVIDSTGVSPTPPPPPPVDDRFVDLGLPSGTLWAKYNVGVNPNDLTTAAKWYGAKHSWAVSDDESSSDFDWEEYKWAGRDEEHFTKYTTSSNFAESGTPDNKKIIEQADDCVYAALGEGTQVPSYADWKELYDNCTGVFIATYNGVSNLRVLKLTSKTNGAELVLPLCNQQIKTISGAKFLYPTNQLTALSSGKSLPEDDECFFFIFETSDDGVLNDYDTYLLSRSNGYYHRGVKKQ